MRKISIMVDVRPGSKYASEIRSYFFLYVYLVIFFKSFKHSSWSFLVYRCKSVFNLASKVQYTHLNPFPTDNFKKYSKKTDIEIIKSKIFMRFNFITKLCSQEWAWLCNKVETCKDFRFCYFWLYIYTKIPRMVVFGLLFLLLTNLLIFSYNFQLLLTFTCQFYQTS